MDLNVTPESSGGGAVACPVCTLYLREGISLQRHLDTHPKEQVIEALIKASSSGSSLTSPQPQPSLPPPPPPTPAPSQPQTTATQPLPTPTQATSAQGNSPHMGPGTPYPIGPVFEYPMMPPQFASFSYQQFVNNGTMMIPQYSMAPPPPPQANQMMQMLYNPYSMYQQQQVPTVQMLSPVTTIPTTRMRPVVTVAETSTRSLMMPSGTGSDPKLIESEHERILPDIETPGEEVTETTTEVRNDERLQMEDREQQTRSREDDDEVRVERIESSASCSQEIQMEPERRPTAEPEEKPEDEDPLGDRVSREAAADSQEVVPMEDTTPREEVSPEVEHLEHFLMNMMEENLTRSESPSLRRPEGESGDRETSVEVGGGNSQDSKPYPSDGENEVSEVEIISKVFSEVYRHKRSVSAPASPSDPKKTHNLTSRSECGSTENLNLYPMGFEATTLHEDLDDEDEDDEELDEDEKDNFDEEDMEIEEIASPHTPFPRNPEGRSHSPLSAISGISVLRVRRDLSKPNSPASVNSFRHLHGDSDDETENMVANSLSCPREGLPTDAPAGERKFEAASVITEGSFQQNMILPDNNYSPEKMSSSQNPLEELDPTTSAESKTYTSKPVNHPPTAELLNINEDAHSGPMNVFEFDGLQILVPSTFISESSQKAISATSQQSMASSEGGIGVDEEVKSVNMRADETMPPRGELSEQESNGCTEPSAWQLYMGQESSRMSTSYDLMARESWEESEGSDNETGVPLLDSKSLATHFTSSLFLDRDRKTPTKQRTYKCSLCPEVFDCPKERRVHITTIHKEPGPSNSSSNCDPIDNPETKDIKLLEGRMNVFEEIFVPGIHVQPTYHQLQGQAQGQGQSAGEIGKTEADEKPDALGDGLIGDHACAMCSQRFTTERSLQAHNRRVHGTEVARRLHDLSKCQICNEQFTSVGLFNEHLKVHPLECSQCGKYFYRKQNFRLHMKRHLGIKPFPCTVCDKAFLTKQKLDEHMNGHTGNAPVKCNMCNETFRRYSNLTQHKNRHHLNIKKKLKDYICHCGEVFHTKKKLAWHKETHDEKPKACTYCNERFIHMASLTRHMRRAHNRRFVPDAQRENENVECPICKCIYLRSSLSVHMRVHNGERPFECQVCSKSFSTKWNLQLHKWTHAARSTKPFKCNQCSAAFYRHSDYVAHMNAHRNFRPYTCNYCGAQFIRKYNCLRHVKEHEENKQYSCDVCKKTFHRSYYLKEHLRVHSGVRPYTCHICGKSSSTKSNHNKHVRIHHAREPVNTEN